MVNFSFLFSYWFSFGIHDDWSAVSFGLSSYGYQYVLNPIPSWHQGDNKWSHSGLQQNKLNILRAIMGGRNTVEYQLGDRNAIGLIIIQSFCFLAWFLSHISCTSAIIACCGWWWTPHSTQGVILPSLLIPRSDPLRTALLSSAIRRSNTMEWGLTNKSMMMRKTCRPFISWNRGDYSSCNIWMCVWCFYLLHSSSDRGWIRTSVHYGKLYKSEIVSYSFLLQKYKLTHISLIHLLELKHLMPFWIQVFPPKLTL